MNVSYSLSNEVILDRGKFANTSNVITIELPPYLTNYVKAGEFIVLKIADGRTAKLCVPTTLHVSMLRRTP